MNRMEKLYLTSDTARELYEKYVKDLPIVDYHCHLPPQEIYEDAPYDNIGAMWLEHDHYKWRLMRMAGVEEDYITGDRPWLEKFKKYAKAVSKAVGSPLYEWTYLELKLYFGIDCALNPQNAVEIWERANRAIRDKRISPRALISNSKVEYIGTTDDPLDTLQYHEKLQKDDGFSCVVTPSFRADNLLLINRPEFPEYVRALEKTAGIQISGIDDYMKAISLRLDHFCKMGCRFADVGIEFFPETAGEKALANEALLKAMDGITVSKESFHSFLGFLYRFLGEEYSRRNIVSQFHLGVKRNPNTRIFKEKGPDAGADCVGNRILPSLLLSLLDDLDKKEALPQTILYGLDPSMTYSLASVAGSFRNVSCGSAWWINDHRRGIREHINTFAETGHLARFFGMVTDSRSFLSYARHDFFRRVVCSVIGEWVDKGEVFDTSVVGDMLYDICYGNSKKLTEGR